MTMRSESFTCSDCEQPIQAYQWHDCKGTYDIERYIVTKKLPRSARKRIAKKYGIADLTSEIDKIARKVKMKGLVPTTRPTSPNEGDVWFDEALSQVNVFMKGAWYNISTGMHNVITNKEKKKMNTEWSLFGEEKPLVIKGITPSIARKKIVLGPVGPVGAMGVVGPVGPMGISGAI